MKVMTWGQLLTRARPKLMRKFGDDEPPQFSVQVDQDLNAPAMVVARLESGDGRGVNVHLQVIERKRR